jgi:hypothetical protein
MGIPNIIGIYLGMDASIKQEMKMHGRQKRKIFFVPPCKS